MKRKTIALILALSVFFGLCSCRTEETTEITEPSVPTESTVPAEIYEFISESTRYIDPDNGDDTEALVEEAISGMERAILVRNGNGFLDRNFLNSLDYGSFWVKSFSYFDYEAGENIYTIYIFDYGGLTAEEVASMKGEIDSAMFQLIAALPPRANDPWKKTMAVHDELIDRTVYTPASGEGSGNAGNIYGALVENTANAAGYAFAMRQILHAMGISSSVVTSDIHSWVRIEDDYGDVFIDTAADDTTSEDSGGRLYRNYEYFGLTEPEVRQIDPGAYFLPTDGGRTGFNYYSHEGWLFTDFGSVDVTNAFREQYEGGANILTVRFENEDSYQAALDFFSDSTRTWNVLRSSGVTESDCWKIHNDDLFILSIGLDNIEEEETEEPEA